MSPQMLQMTSTSLEVAICADRVDQLPLFTYNRGWENQPNSRGENIPIIRIPYFSGAPKRDYFQIGLQ